jgi:hypothetical protein
MGATDTGGTIGGTVDVSLVTPGEDLAATLISQILANMP